MILFNEIEAPRKHAKFSKQNNLVWYTWSDIFTSEIELLQKQIRKAKEVDFLYLKKYREYNYTYSVDVSRLEKSFITRFRNYAIALYHFSPEDKVRFFTNLIRENINGKMFHFIFALLRSLLVEYTGDKMSALYSPLASGKKENDFPLHCDLYIPKILFNVFENVASGNSGHSTFLDLNTLFKSVLPKITEFDSQKREYLSKLIYQDVRKDNYEKFYSTLYPNDAVASKVKKLQSKHQLRIKLQKGEGYMLHDRIWMHGRDKTNGGVSSKRLHRLIFNNFMST